MIELIDIYKSFGQKKVLQGVNLKIFTGQCMVILGRSGTGKSVLLKHIVGLIQPEKGKVIVDGVDINRISESRLYEIRRNIGFVFQGGGLFDSMDVFTNVALPLIERRNITEEDIKNRVMEVLELVDMEEAAYMMPSELSGGMRKRVAIARALVAKPQYILYDEPTTGLDPIISERINDLIIELNSQIGVTSVVVTHDIHSALRIADRIVLLSDGKVRVDVRREDVWNVPDPEFQNFLQVFKALKSIE
jgi:phospholipid/cholesterol/gamma-HCH transport system ATP-binding protein